MGQSITTAVKQKGKKAANPSWSGWIYIQKHGILKTSWKRRFCRLTMEKLFYFKNELPSKGSKGWISLVDMIAMIQLPYHNDKNQDKIPFLLLGTTTTVLLLFEMDFERDSFMNHLIEMHRIPLYSILTEDWSIVQLNRKKPDQFIRFFIVFVGSGDLLFFRDGTFMELVHRIRMVEMKNVHVVYDAAAGNGVLLSPRARALAAARIDGPTIDIVVDERIVRLEFDSMSQYEKWRELLVDALAGDYTGMQFQQRQVIAVRRKQFQRQQKKEDLKKKRKTKAQRTTQQRNTMYDGNSSDTNVLHGSGGRLTDVSVSRTSSVVDSSEWSAVSDFALEVAEELHNISSERVKSKKTKQQITGDPLNKQGDSSKVEKKRKKKKETRKLHVNEEGQSKEEEEFQLEASNVSNNYESSTELGLRPLAETPGMTTSRRGKSKATRTRIDLFASPTTSPRDVSVATLTTFNPSTKAKDSESTQSVFDSKRQNLLARLGAKVDSTLAIPATLKKSAFESKKEELLARLAGSEHYSPLSPKIPAPAVIQRIDLPEVTRPRRTSISTMSSIQIDLKKRHQNLQEDFTRLQQTIQGDSRRTKRLQRQINACARAIDTLGALVMYPPEEPIVPPILDAELLKQHGHVEVQGNWFTTELRGGAKVRHWQLRVPKS